MYLEKYYTTERPPSGPHIKCLRLLDTFSVDLAEADPYLFDYLWNRLDLSTLGFLIDTDHQREREQLQDFTIRR